MKNGLKLFVWEKLSYDYPAGKAVALAHDVEEARGLIAKKAGSHFSADLLREPEVIEGPVGFYVYGGINRPLGVTAARPTT